MTKTRKHLGKNVGLLILRVTFGALIMGHGSQKLFGWFSGPGMAGTTGWLGSMNMRPAKFWALLAGLSEFGGGLLMTLGFLNPIGPLAAFGAMAMATTKAHLGKPIWASKGGAELPLTNMAIASALMAQGPGDFSLDRALGLRLPRWLLIPGLLGIAATLAYAQFGTRLPALQAKVAQLTQSAAQSAKQVGQQAVQQVTRQTQPTTTSAGATGSNGATTSGTTQMGTNQTGNRAGATGQTPSLPRGSR